MLAAISLLCDAVPLTLELVRGVPILPRNTEIDLGHDAMN